LAAYQKRELGAVRHIINELRWYCSYAGTQGIEKVLKKLAQILTAKGSSEVIDMLEELEKSSQMKKDIKSQQSGKTTNLGNFTNLTPTSNEVSRSN
jgi:hypothetical protein